MGRYTIQQRLLSFQQYNRNGGILVTTIREVRQILGRNIVAKRFIAHFFPLSSFFIFGHCK